MIRLLRRTEPTAGVRFCDGCAEVTTAAQRARDRHDQTRTAAYTLAGVR